MIRMLFFLVIVFLLVVFIWQLKNYLIRNKKLDELSEVKLESDLMDIDREIAAEKARQKEASSKIEGLYTQDDNEEDIK